MLILKLTDVIALISKGKVTPLQGRLFGAGMETLSYINLHNHETILILSDINIPGMSGLDLLQNIKSNYATPSPVS